MLLKSLNVEKNSSSLEAKKLFNSGLLIFFPKMFLEEDDFLAAFIESFKATFKVLHMAVLKCKYF